MSQRIASVPPMGWNSWNTFYDQISEGLVLEICQAMQDQGLQKAGYEYLILDDCWSRKERDCQGRLVPDGEKFPQGIQYLADCVHRAGLKFGLYSCCGLRTCAGHPGSFGHEAEDARLFAQWGVDYLKYDNCFRPASQCTPLLYRRMGMALRSSGRDILFAACQWGTEHVHRWIQSAGVHTFRSTVDIQDSWQSVSAIALSQKEYLSFQRPGCFNDLDMLVVGMHGSGMNPETSMGGCSDEEYQTHFALWAMMNSPLIIGCDVRTMTEKTREILTNPDLIAINQDPECRSCVWMEPFSNLNPDTFVLVKLLRNGELALGLFNFSDTAANVATSFWDMGVPPEFALRFYDCLGHEETGLFREFFSQAVPSHGCRVYRCSLEAL